MRLIDPPDGRPWALFGLCGASLLLNAALIGKIALSPAPAVPVAAVPAQEIAAVASDAPVAPDAEVAAAAPEVAVAEAAPVLDGSVKVIHADVQHSLARTFQNAVPDHADVVSAVYARLFVWDLDLRRDLQAGDQITVAYEWDGELAAIPVASYQSGKLGKTLRAYRYTATGDAYPSWWDETGTEVPRRLVNGPLRNYEQVTSLLKDRPKHKGMDFKVPVGTEVISPKAGSVVRTDWNFTYNGNCAEVRYDDGTTARFLHMSETQAKPGQRLSAGSVVGLTGNTGRSTAPHLHYEIDKNGTVIDPVDYHGVTRRQLGEADLQGFHDERSRLDAMLNTAT